MSASRVASAGFTVMIAVLGTMIVPSLSDVARSSESVARSVPEIGRLPKGDRLALVPAKTGSTVAAVSSSGGRETFIVTLRDREGAVVYVSDRVRQATRVARDTVIGGIPVPGEPVVGAIAQAVQVSAPLAGAKVRRVPVGCERLVSILVKSAAADMPGRCMT